MKNKIITAMIFISLSSLALQANENNLTNEFNTTKQSVLSKPYQNPDDTSNLNTTSNTLSEYSYHLSSHSTQTNLINILSALSF